MFSLEAVYFNVILFVVLKERLAKLSYPFNKCADDGDVSTTSNECPTMKQKGCSCGCRVKSRSQLSCKQAEGQTSRCPCVRKGKICTRYCKCRHCSNNTGVKKIVKCRCGEGRKTILQGFVSCIDIKGERNTVDKAALKAAVVLITKIALALLSIHGVPVYQKRKEKRFFQVLLL